MNFSRFRFAALCALGFIAVGLQSQSTSPEPDARRAKRQRQVQQALRRPLLRPVVRGQRAAVAAGTPLVTDAAMRMFHAGGNAVDAGVAALFAGAVSEFSHFGFGGEAPLLIRTADGEVHSIAGLGPAPKRMTREFFQGLRTDAGQDQEIRRRGRTSGPIPSYGLLPALVPGMVDGGLLALKRFGTMSLAEVIQPAIELAEGMPLDEVRARSILQATRFFRSFPTSRRVFLPNGRVPRPGRIFHQPDLAATLRSMAATEKAALKKKRGRDGAIDAVRDHFYRGEIARRIGRFVQENSGLLRYEDMAAYRAEVEAPITTNYRGFEVYKGGFWTQGAVMIEALNILEGFDLKKMGWNTDEYIHALVEALKLAYADRDTYYADPKFSDVPEQLLSKVYGAQRRESIDLLGASREFLPGDFGDPEPPHPSRFVGQLRPFTDELASRDTTCINVIDKEGVMFSATPSGAWMPSVIAGDTGIPLTQRAQSFVMIPDHPNVVEPGKRPRITLSPTLVTQIGRPWMALSTPGGDQQEQALLQVLLAVLEFGLNPQAAIEAPRFQTKHMVASFDDHAIERNLLLLDERIPADVIQRLSLLGHRLERRSRWDSGSAPTAVKVHPSGAIEAGADPFAYRYAAAW